MELYHLKTFMAVAEEGHLTRAAERLHLSQPSVSAHIKVLEQELGLTLFIRTPRGMTLTREGALLKDQVRAAVQAVEAVGLKAAELSGGLAAEIRVGLNIDSRYLKITDLLALLREEPPNLELHFFQKHSLEAIEEVRSGGLEAAFVFISPDDPDLEAIKLSNFGVVVVGPAQWQTRLEKITVHDMADFPWVWMDPRCPFHQISRQLFEVCGRLPEKAVVVDSDATIRKMVASGAGLGLMVQPEALEAAGNHEVVVITEGVATLDLFLLFPKKKASQPALRRLVERVRRVWTQAA